jgi:hypothetical protein
MPRVLYYVSDTQVPSWGVGMIYTHVRLLCANGIDSAVLHTEPGFKPQWMNADAPRAYLGDPRFRIGRDDLLVVPEVHAAERDVLKLARRRLGSARDYRQLGYQGAIAIMPHVQRILERHYGLEAPVIPPCIAPWFFDKQPAPKSPRKLEVVLCSKAWCRDFPIVRHTLRAGARAIGWTVVELENKPHRHVARAFRRAAIHVNVNCQESFNATVPEAMAAGCVPVCYEAFGGQDYLRHGENAYVYPTHHAYPLAEGTLKLMAAWDSKQREVNRIRRGGQATARRYTEDLTEKALLAYFGPLR